MAARFNIVCICQGLTMFPKCTLAWVLVLFLSGCAKAPVADDEGKLSESSSNSACLPSEIQSELIQLRELAYLRNTPVDINLLEHDCQSSHKWRVRFQYTVSDSPVFSSDLVAVKREGTKAVELIGSPLKFQSVQLASDPMGVDAAKSAIRNATQGKIQDIKFGYSLIDNALVPVYRAGVLERLKRYQIDVAAETGKLLAKKNTTNY